MKIFKTPFAATGDRIAIPVVEQPSGEISQPTGWTPDYQLPNTDPNYKPVGRDELNGVLYEITEALGQLQQFGFADWQSITGGWPIGANVLHAGSYWQSLANANTEEPGTGVLWKELLFGNLVPASETIQGLVSLATTAEAQALVNDTDALTPKKLSDALVYLGISPAGIVVPFAGPVANIPQGWLLCDNSTVSRTAYARLFAAIGTTYGAGDGVTTFNLPELRGEFIRGLDNGRGVNPGRGLGTWEEDAFKSHSHSGTYGFYSPQVGVGGATVGGVTGNQNTGLTGGAETRPRNVAMNHIIKY